MNATELGNQFGLLCPKCKRGDALQIVATTTVRLYPDGTEDHGDHEWDDASGASCRECDWSGNVGELDEIPDFDPDA